VKVESEMEVPVAASTPFDVRKGRLVGLDMVAERLVGGYLSWACISCYTWEVVGCAVAGHTGLLVIQNMPIVLLTELAPGQLLGHAAC
jgi:hypothetical protein